MSKASAWRDAKRRELMALADTDEESWDPVFGNKAGWLGGPQEPLTVSGMGGGLSQVKVEIKPEYWSDRLPQVWDMLRRKIRDVETNLPPGAGRPIVGDDYGDVFGFQPDIGRAFGGLELGRDGLE